MGTVTVYLDASVLVALLTLEEGFEEFADAIDRSDDRLTSAVSVWEATIALSRSRGIMLDLAIADMSSFLEARGVIVVPIGSREAAIALDAHRHFGKGRHAARLNMGDCFSYGCAKAYNAELLYKGDDFAKTDLA